MGIDQKCLEGTNNMSFSIFVDLGTVQELLRTVWEMFGTIQEMYGTVLEMFGNCKISFC